MLQNHKLTLSLAILTAAAATFLPYFPQVPAGLATAIMGFLGTVTTLIKTYSDPPEKPDVPMTTGIVWLVALFLGGCASFGHWSPSALPDVAALCAISSELQPQIDAIAIKYGVPVSYVEQAFKLACAETAKSDPDGARPAGLAAARAGAHAARMARAKFETDAGAP